MRWWALGFIDAISVAAYVLGVLLVFSALSIGVSQFAVALGADTWALALGMFAGALLAYLFAVTIAPTAARHLRGMMREWVVRPVRNTASTAASDYLSGKEQTGGVLFLRSFNTERNAWRSDVRIRDTALFDALEGYLWERAYVLFPLLAAAKLARAIYLRLPLWKAVDEHLAEALWPEKLLISVGGPQPPQGVFGAIAAQCSESDWRTTVGELAVRAEIIVVVPGPTPGIEEEALLVSRSPSLRQKTVFIWPAGQDRENGAYAAASDKLFRAGLRVPHFDERGVIFNLQGGAESLDRLIESPESARRLLQETVSSAVNRIQPQKEVRFGLQIGTLVVLLLIAAYATAP